MALSFMLILVIQVLFMILVLYACPLHMKIGDHILLTLISILSTLLGDLGYIDTQHYIMRQLGWTELHQNVDSPAIDAYNKMHARFCIKVEWGIGGLKRKWQRLMK
jgi:hypothetical protein